ncbi:uncharacterized protein VTP21DRAFT_4009 [Calcarisporiella thermophila]|uniref:uncharacterized protein n=1 Tax=Calcarisporiella thermophila TaxID=911321 RepID=UPI0037426E77
MAISNRRRSPKNDFTTASEAVNATENEPLISSHSKLSNNLRLLNVIVFGVLLVFAGYLWFLRTGNTLYIVHNANVITMDSSRPHAEAFVVQNGKFIEVGEKKNILKKWKNKGTVYDLNNKTIVPGIIDAHGHLMELGQSILQPDLTGANSIEEVRERLLKKIAKLRPEAGQWIRGFGWDQNRWPEGKFPTAEDLDKEPILAQYPIVLYRIDYHAYWVNGKVISLLQEQGIDLEQTLDGGEIIKDPGYGVFVDNAMFLVEKLVPKFTEEENLSALDAAITELHSVGITGMHNAFTTPSRIEFFKRAIQYDRFPLRVYAMLACEEKNTYCGHLVPPFEIAGKLSVKSVKLFMDGAIGSWGAAMMEPYTDDPTKSGFLLMNSTYLAEVARQWANNGYQVNVHCIGDLANHITINTFEEILKSHSKEAPNNGFKLNHFHRFRIEHAQILTLDDIRRVSELGIIPSMQPTHATSDMSYAEKRLGPERIKGAYAWKSFLNSGSSYIALGSDFPIEKSNPLLGFYAAITRKYTDGTSPSGDGGWYPEQTLTREEALRGFTIDAAYAAFQENEVGSISPGKFADFVVFSKDIMTIPEKEILESKVLGTVLDGQIVFGKLEGYKE